jgi:hypothetical protein
MSRTHVSKTSCWVVVVVVVVVAEGEEVEVVGARTRSKVKRNSVALLFTTPLSGRSFRRTSMVGDLGSMVMAVALEAAEVVAADGRAVAAAAAAAAAAVGPPRNGLTRHTTWTDADLEVPTAAVVRGSGAREAEAAREDGPRDWGAEEEEVEEAAGNDEVGALSIVEACEVGGPRARAG